jgi:hypothetical protein
MPNGASSNEKELKRGLETKKREALRAKNLPATGTPIEPGKTIPREPGTGTPIEPGRGETEMGRARKLRQSITRAREMAAAVKGAPEAAKEAAAQVGQIFTARALNFSWLNLIDSFGLTFLYILFHFVMAYIVGSQAFCKFGEEWAPPKAPQAQKEFAKSFGAEIFEIIGMFLILVIIIVAVLVIFSAVLLSLGVIGEATLGVIKTYLWIKEKLGK